MGRRGPSTDQYCWLWDFFSHWKRYYPHLKIANRREDICNLCFAFSQKHNVVYTPQPFDTESLTTVSRNTNSEAVDEEWVEENTIYDDDMIGVDISFDKGVYSELKEKTITEDEIHASVRHVRSAKAQRLYLRNAIANAVADLTNNKHHSERHYVFIGDYSQNLEVPFMGSEQPGETYYLTPYNAYCFGMVDVAHLFDDNIAPEKVGDFMYAYVYESLLVLKGQTMSQV